MKFIAFLLKLLSNEEIKETSNNGGVITFSKGDHAIDVKVSEGDTTSPTVESLRGFYAE